MTLLMQPISVMRRWLAVKRLTSSSNSSRTGFTGNTDPPETLSHKPISVVIQLSSGIDEAPRAK